MALMMNRIERWNLAWHALLLAIVAGAAQFTVNAQFSFKPKGDPIVTVTTAWSHSGVKPGGEINLAVVLAIQKPFHINSDTATDPFIPTRVEVSNAPPEVQSSTALFPAPENLEFGPDKQLISVFSDRTVIYIPMAVTTAASPGEKEIELKVSYQACDDKVCLFPTSATATTKLNVVAPAAEVTAANPELFAGMKEITQKLKVAFFGWDFAIEPSNLAILLLIAAIGGFLLNLTPCVLPLIPIKIMGLSQAAGNWQRCFLLGLTMSAGVVVFWLALAVAISTISGFGATNQLFQYPAFTITVGLIICVMAIGMCGVFSVGLPAWVYRFNPSHESIGGSFLFGIMTAILSTPCTAPFMGAAAAWSATQKPIITLSTFAAIGSGMALPYLMLSAFPVLVNRMPRAGAASELIKQVMGLLMLAAGAYFLGTGAAGILAKAPDPPSQAYWWIVALFIAAAGLWLAWRTFRITQRPTKRLIFGAVGIALVAVGVLIALRFTERSPVNWIYYTPDRFAEAQKNGKVIVLEFTAAWCLNCHALEQAVLHDSRVVKALNSDDVIPIKVDITGNNPQGSAKLLELGRRSIPYLVIYSTKGEIIFSSDAYTIDQVLTAIDKAK